MAARNFHFVMTTAASMSRSSESPPSGSPLVSILIPAYNAATWIGQSIQSALDQTYSPVEVIVMDDGSTDGTAGEIRKFGDRVTLVQGRHAGANPCRNALTQLARGEWLQYLDADDYLLPGKVAGQIGFLASRDWRFDLVHSPTIIRWEGSGEESATAIDPPYDAAVQFVRWIPFCTHGMLLRRSAVLRAGGWREDQPVCQEHELVYRLITGNTSIGVWNQPATVYRFHSTATVSRNNPLRTMQVRMGILERFEEWLTQSGQMTPVLRKEIYIARLDTARMAWQIDESYGEMLARKASKDGHYWASRQPALPMSFQLTARMVGFGAAQRLARFRRGSATGKLVSL
jgi:glycosyltransferase involved in cell wall biosynthesis